MSQDDSIDLFDRVRDGQSQAQHELFDRYVIRLLALVRKRLSPKYARRIDPEDVVQSAYRSFFAAAEDDRYVLEHSGDLWRLLAAITVNKLHHQIEKNQAAKRAVNREHSVQLQLGDSLCQMPIEGVANEPTPDDEVALNEEIRFLMESFDDKQQQMLELRLSGCTIVEIGERLDCSERTVRRFFDQKLKPLLEQRLIGK